MGEGKVCGRMGVWEYRGVGVWECGGVARAL